MMERKELICLAALLVASGSVYAGDGNTDKNKTGSHSRVTSIQNGSGSAQRISVVNGEVTINGQRIPREVRRHRTEDGTTYRIERSGPGGNSVSVTTEYN
ncbi:hypothetical protein [Telmatospirillum sp. J64-1]|uniref:hypothetical protein n=1 Tax=Telmatospirillum sp. J64-1 TaxID=2502183 RepID=UPI00115F609C|nr:hypothetical protein [Telmatospirillum sp. J64-1]